MEEFQVDLERERGLHICRILYSFTETEIDILCNRIVLQPYSTSHQWGKKFRSRPNIFDIHAEYNYDAHFVAQTLCITNQRLEYLQVRSCGLQQN